MTQSKRLEGGQIYLRPITKKDTGHIIRWRNSEAVRKHFIYRKTFTGQEHEQWLEDIIDTKKGYQFIVCLKEDGRPVGSTFLKDVDREHRKAEYGIFLGEDCRGRGIGKESLRLTLGFAFGELGLHKVFSRIFTDNLASINTLLRVGFSREGVLKEDVWVDGEYRDMAVLAIFNPED